MSIASQSLASWVSARAGAALAASPRPEVTSLGTQLFEGVLATGAKAGVAVPPGPIGNEQTLTMTSEIWYSPELSAAVLIRNSDARFGETIVRLRNIRRGDPDSSLFEIPAGYRLLGDGMPGAARAETRPRR
ncbi:MAG TPA: hypothetical protein VNY05_33750 [Candidatus Acidoferrales bacterium]|nr:hypothetical protein [Candidatus Acidoferrales bacterium]